MSDIKDAIQAMSNELGEAVDFVTMMEDFTIALQEKYVEKVDEYLGLVPKTDEAVVILAANCPSALVSVLVNLHRGQRIAMGTNETPIYQMMQDSLGLFEMEEDQLIAAHENITATRH